MSSPRRVRFKGSSSPESTSSTLSSSGPSTPPSALDIYTFAPKPNTELCPSIAASPDLYTELAPQPPVVPPEETRASLHRYLSPLHISFDASRRVSSEGIDADILSSCATYPPVAEMTLQSTRFPWKLSIKPEIAEVEAVTVLDVMIGIYVHLRTLVKGLEYDELKADPAMYSAVYAAFVTRCDALEEPRRTEERRRGLRRVDFLCGRTRFAGLVPAQGDEWSIVFEPV